MFKFRLKWYFEALIIDGTVPSGHLRLNSTAVPGVFDKMMDMDTLNFHLLRRFQAKNGIGIQNLGHFWPFLRFFVQKPMKMKSNQHENFRGFFMADRKVVYRFRFSKSIRKYLSWDKNHETWRKFEFLFLTT